MNEDLHNIDDLFKKAFEEHTEPASSTVWDNIDKNLDKTKVVSISKKYNKLKWAAAILLLFSFGMAMYSLHIRIKNKELVKQNNAVKILKNLQVQTKNTLEDSANLTEKNKPGIEKALLNTEHKQQENNNSSIITGDNKIDLREDKNMADNVKQRKIQTQENTETKLPPDEKKDNRSIQQNSKQLLLKNKPANKMQEKSDAIISEYNRMENPEESIITNNDKGISVNKEQQEKLHSDIISPKEKYVTAIPIESELKDMFQMLMIKPVSQTPNLTANNNVPLKDGIVFIKKRNIKNGNLSPFSASIFFSPDFVTTKIKNDHPRFREEERNEIEKDEKVKSSSTIGVLIDYNISKKWTLESGFTFSTRITDIQPKTIYARPDDNGNINYRFNCSSGYSYVTLKSSGSPVSGDSIRTLASKNTLQYIGVPLVLKYMFSKGRFSVTPGIGISANFLTAGKIKTTIVSTTGNESAASNNIQGLKSMYINGSASVGAQYKLSKNFELTFIPTARIALSPINKNTPVTTNLNSIGFVTGVIIRL